MAQAVTIPANDLKRPFELHADAYEQKALEVLRSGWYILGKEVSAFEQAFADYLGAKCCVGLASGLDALWMAFRLLGIGPGDEVIVCANAYIACVMGITINGASPVFVEPDAYDNIDAGRIEAAVTPQPRPFWPCISSARPATWMRSAGSCKNTASAGGGLRPEPRHPVSRETIRHLRRYRLLQLLSHQGPGRLRRRRRIVTDDEELAGRCRALRNYGSRVKYHNEVVGANSRLDELQAGLLHVKLGFLDELNAERRRSPRAI